MPSSTISPGESSAPRPSTSDACSLAPRFNPTRPEIRAAPSSPVDALEHFTLLMLLALALTGIGGLALAALGWFSGPVLSLLSFSVAGAAVVLGTRGVPRRVPVGALAALVLLLGLFAAAVWPPAEFVLGGWDTGAYFNTGAALVRNGSFFSSDPFLATAEPEARAPFVAPNGPLHPYLYPGFYLPDGAGAIVPQYPMLLSLWIGVGVLLGGAPGGLATAPAVGLFAVGLFFLLLRRAWGTPVALAGALLLATNGVQVWHAQQTLSEELLQVFLFGGLLAGLLALRRPEPLYAGTAGLLLATLPLVKTEATVLAALALGTVGLALFRHLTPAFGTPSPLSERGTGGEVSFLPGTAFIVGAALGGVSSLAHYATTARFYVSEQIASAPGYLGLAGAVLFLSLVVAVVVVRSRQSLFPWRLRFFEYSARRPKLVTATGAALISAVLPLAWFGSRAVAGTHAAIADLMHALYLGTFLSPADLAVFGTGVLVFCLWHPLSRWPMRTAGNRVLIRDDRGPEGRVPSRSPRPAVHRGSSPSGARRPLGWRSFHPALPHLPVEPRTAPMVVLVALALGSVLYLPIYAYYVHAQDRLPLYMWATRRLLPTVIPLLALAEVLVLAWALRKLPLPGGYGPLLVGAAALLALGHLPALQPFLQHRQYQGALEQLAEVRARVPQDAVLLLDSDDAGIRLAPPLRFLYGRDAYVFWNREQGTGNEGNAEQGRPGMQALREWAGAGGRAVWYLTATPRSAGYTVLKGGAQIEGSVAVVLPEFAQTSAGRPDRSDLYRADLALFRLSSAVLSETLPARVDVGAEDAVAYALLREGWYGRERESGGPTYRWTNGAGTVSLPQGLTGAAQVLFHLGITDRPEGAPAARTTVWCGTREVGTLDPEPGFPAHTLLLPAACALSEERTLTLRTEPWSPAAFGGADGRVLGIRVDWIVFDAVMEETGGS